MNFTIDDAENRVRTFWVWLQDGQPSPTKAAARYATIVTAIVKGLRYEEWEKLLRRLGGTAKLGPIIVRLETKIDRRREFGIGSPRTDAEDDWKRRHRRSA